MRDEIVNGDHLLNHAGLSSLADTVTNLTGALKGRELGLHRSCTRVQRRHYNAYAEYYVMFIV